MTETLYKYCWGKNPKRATYKGRVCRLLAAGRIWTVLIEFCDTGERTTTSRRALRKEFKP